MDPVVKVVPCPSCGKSIKVRCLPAASRITFQCPSCKKVQRDAPVQ